MPGRWATPEDEDYTFHLIPPPPDLTPVSDEEDTPYDVHVDDCDKCFDAILDSDDIEGLCPEGQALWLKTQ